MTKLVQSIDKALSNALCIQHPFTHWHVQNILTEDFCQLLCNKIPPREQQLLYDGTRAGDLHHAAKNNNERHYVTKTLISQYPFLDEIIKAMLSPDLILKLNSLFCLDLSNCYLRVEYTSDHDGFYLQPHKDIVEKLFTLFIYLGDSPENCGTDLYDEEKKWVKTIPFKHNTGYIFLPGSNTWHGFEPKKIPDVRHALLINYVTFKTDWPLF